MENSFNKGVGNLKKYLYNILLLVLGLFLLGLFLKASLYIGIAALSVFAIYKMWQAGKAWYFKLKKNKEKRTYEREISKMRENKGNTTYMEVEVSKDDIEEESTRPFTYIDVQYEEVQKTK